MPAGDVSFDMVREHMHEIPQLPLPAPYRFRTYRDGDEATWLSVQRAAEPIIPMPDDFFQRQFGAHLDALPGRMFFVEDAEGRVAGTITAWWEHDRQDANGRGRIHWVAVHPDYQRRGLAKPMMTHAMNRLAQEYRRAMLGTSSSRVWAVKVYLDFGFRPDPAQLNDPAIAGAWRALQAQLQHPALADLAALRG
jgi:ribosomal protein S18 acetylase RimI-like enzyme